MRARILRGAVTAVALTGVYSAGFVHQAVGATATETGSTDDGLEQAVSTALKRTEELQKSATAVSAITGDRLRASGGVDAQSLTNMVPGVEVGYNDRGDLQLTGIAAQRWRLRQIDFPVLAARDARIVAKVGWASLCQTQRRHQQPDTTGNQAPATQSAAAAAIQNQHQLGHLNVSIWFPAGANKSMIREALSDCCEFIREPRYHSGLPF